MSARSIATGNISFGLVSIPVKLFSATQPSAGVSFNLLHKKCGGRLKQQYICPADNDELVPREEMVKGYEFAKDRYVTFSAEELKTLEERATQAIEIVEFVPLEKIDPIYFDKPYYLGPDKGGEKAYRLLSEAMQRTKRAALARYAARGKGYLVMLRPSQGGLVMQQLLYADEVRPMSEVPMGEGEVKEPELNLAVQLVNQISTEDFKPEAYEDEVRKRTLDLIQKKVEGQDVSLAPPEPARSQVIDLMEALKASLAKPAPGATPGTAEPKEEDERKPAKRARRDEAENEEKAKASKK
jgi:DNA end-binding protein Ku